MAFKQDLTPDELRVCRGRGTEVPFTGAYWRFTGPEECVYKCKCCGNPLFSGMDKFDSGTGWPSFTKPISSQSDPVKENPDPDGSGRTEAKCSACDAHLGHVFEDGPLGVESDGTGLRYCINSVSLYKSQ